MGDALIKTLWLFVLVKLGQLSVRPPNIVKVVCFVVLLVKNVHEFYTKSHYKTNSFFHLTHSVKFLAILKKKHTAFAATK